MLNDLWKGATTAKFALHYCFWSLHQHIKATNGCTGLGRVLWGKNKTKFCKPGKLFKYTSQILNITDVGGIKLGFYVSHNQNVVTNSIFEYFKYTHIYIIINNKPNNQI